MNAFVFSLFTLLIVQTVQVRAEDNPTFLEKSPLIFGGAPTDKAKFPYFVEVRSQALCGGSLIHPSYILTAGHCVGGPVESFNIVFGNGSSEKVVEVIRHPEFNLQESANDIALMKLRNPVTNVQLANLKLDTSPQVGEDLVIIGIGLTEQGQPSKGLLSVTKKVLPDATCKSTFAVFKEQDHICIDGFNGQTAVNGDSGSPILSNGQQVGIVSFGAKNAAGNAPFVSVQLQRYRNFISSVLGTQAADPVKPVVSAVSNAVAESPSLSETVKNVTPDVKSVISQAPKSVSFYTSFVLFTPLLLLAL
jgi:secreted trypsin-like serine protease